MPWEEGYEEAGHQGGGQGGTEAQVTGQLSAGRCKFVSLKLIHFFKKLAFYHFSAPNDHLVQFLHQLTSQKVQNFKMRFLTGQLVQNAFSDCQLVQKLHQMIIWC